MSTLAEPVYCESDQTPDVAFPARLLCLELKQSKSKPVSLQRGKRPFGYFCPSCTHAYAQIPQCTLYMYVGKWMCMCKFKDIYVCACVCLCARACVLVIKCWKYRFRIYTVLFNNLLMTSCFHSYMVTLLFIVFLFLC